jgi:hypothetical protein
MLMTFAAPGFAARLSNALEAWSSWSVTEHRCGVSHPRVVIATCRPDFRDRPAVDSASGAGMRKLARNQGFSGVPSPHVAARGRRQTCAC